MTNFLVIQSSMRYDASVSRQLSNQLVNQLAKPEDTIVVRDLNEAMHFVTERSFAAVKTPATERTSDQQTLAALADTMIAELQQADIVVIGAPIYNFGPTATLKAWADLVARGGTTFTYKEGRSVGLLPDKRAYVIVVSGGTRVHSDIDFLTPWLIHFLGFIGIKAVDVIAADGIYSKEGEQKIQDVHSQIADLATYPPNL